MTYLHLSSVLLKAITNKQTNTKFKALVNNRCSMAKRLVSRLKFAKFNFLSGVPPTIPNLNQRKELQLQIKKHKFVIEKGALKEYRSISCTRESEKQTRSYPIQIRI